jgi:hypothetical protein
VNAARNIVAKGLAQLFGVSLFGMSLLHTGQKHVLDACMDRGVRGQRLQQQRAGV